MAALTFHGSEQMYSRLGICGPAAMERIKAALRDGLTADTASGNLGVYLRHAVIPYSDERAVAHDGALFLFSASDCLVTCWPLPEWCAAPQPPRRSDQRTQDHANRDSLRQVAQAGGGAVLKNEGQ